LRKRPHSLGQLFESFNGGLLALLTLDADDLPAIAALMKRYEDSSLQFADTAVAHLAEREGIRTVFTTDRRDSSIIRLKRNRTLRLIPDIP
jgi:predicted nucleic acid-binding protein